MSSSWSLYKYEGQWQDEPLTQASLTDATLELEIERDGDTVSVAARSDDAVAYAGDYRYREGSNSNGEVRFTRYGGGNGAVLVGEWKESEAVSGPWIIFLNERELPARRS